VRDGAEVGEGHRRASDCLYTVPHNTHAMRSQGRCVVRVIVPDEVEILGRRRSAATPAGE
jgi:hypothetical protein